MVKITLIILLTITSLSARCQDTTYTTTGYEIDFASIHIKVDTLHHICRVYNFFHRKMYFAIDNRKAILLPAMGGVTTVWREHFTIIVTRGRYREVFKI